MEPSAFPRFIQTDNATYLNTSPVNDVTVPPPKDYDMALKCIGISYAFFSVLGIVVNAKIIQTIHRYKKFRRKFTNLILMHMSMTHLLACTFLLPVYAIFLLFNSWIQINTVVCDVMGSFSCGLTLLSLGAITALNIDKYKAITQPLKHSPYVTKLRLGVFVSTVWILAVALVMTANFTGQHFHYDIFLGGCSFNFRPQTGSNIPSVALLCATFVLPTSILLVCYCRIFTIARTHRRHIVGLLHKVASDAQQVAVTSRLRRQSSFVDDYAAAGDRTAVGSILLVLGSYVLLYLPFGAVCIYGAVMREQPREVTLLVASLLFRAHPLVNALVYGFHNKIFTVKCCVARLKKLRRRLQRRQETIHRVETASFEL